MYLPASSRPIRYAQCCIHKNIYASRLSLTWGPFVGTATKRICHTKSTIHSCDCQKYCVLRCETVHSGTTLSAFQRNMSSSSGRSFRHLSWLQKFLWKISRPIFLPLCVLLKEKCTPSTKLCFRIPLFHSSTHLPFLRCFESNSFGRICESLTVNYSGLSSVFKTLPLSVNTINIFRKK